MSTVVDFLNKANIDKLSQNLLTCVVLVTPLVCFAYVAVGIAGVQDRTQFFWTGGSFLMLFLLYYVLIIVVVLYYGKKGVNNSGQNISNQVDPVQQNQTKCAIIDITENMDEENLEFLQKISLHPFSRVEIQDYPNQIHTVFLDEVGNSVVSPLYASYVSGRNKDWYVQTANDYISRLREQKT